MKVLGINGSARKDGNTAILIRKVFAELEKEGIETELIQLAGRKIRGCTACLKCRENKDKQCSVNDYFNKCFDKILEADGIILGSPTYFADVTPEMKALVDRAGYVSRSNGDLLKYKVGGGFCGKKGRRRKHPGIYQSPFLIESNDSSRLELLEPGYWPGKKGEVETDLEGMQTMQVLGQTMAWLLKKINA